MKILQFINLDVDQILNKKARRVNSLIPKSCNAFHQLRKHFLKLKTAWKTLKKKPFRMKLVGF
jgi:hypothetical protein